MECGDDYGGKVLNIGRTHPSQCYGHAVHSQEYDVA